MADEFVWQLSGGQKHLLALAGAIAMKPKVLIIDEPIAQLDPRHAKTIYDVLKTLNEKYGTTIIVIEHHTEFIADYCKQAVLMDQGRIVWKKGVQDALCSVEDLIARQIFPPQVTLAAHEISGDGNYPITIDEAVNYFGVQPTSRSVTPPSTKLAKEPVLQLKNITVRYRTLVKHKKIALNSISLLFTKEIKSLLLEIMGQENPLC